MVPNKTGDGMGHIYPTSPLFGDFTGILNGNKAFIDDLHEKWESNHKNITLLWKLSCEIVKKL